MAEKTPISLTIDLPTGKTETREFTSDEPIMIGSGGSAHVKIADDEVSSLHCMIKPVEGGIVVLDLGSDEGTEVNGKEITGETPINDGDIVQIGSTKIAVHIGGDMLAPTVPIRTLSQGAGSPGAMHGHGGGEPENTLKQMSPPDVTAPDLPVMNSDEGPELPAEAAKGKKEPEKAKKVDVKKADAPKADAKKADAKKTDEKKADAKKPDAKKEPEKKPEAKSEPRRDSAKPEAAKSEAKGRSDKTELVGRKKKSEAMVHSHHGKKAKVQAALTADVPKDQTATAKDNVDVTMMWGGSVMGVVRLGGSGAVTIGVEKGNSFEVSHTSIPAPSFQLVTLDKGGATVNVASGMEALVDGHPSKQSPIKIELGQKVVVRVGAIEFVVQYSRKFTPIAVSLFETVDYLATKIFAIALLLQLALVAMFLITPQFDDDEDDDLLANLNEWQALILTPPEKKQEKKQDLSGKKAAKHKDDEGLFGKKDKPKEDKLASKKGAPTVDKDKREEDRKIAMDALAALGLKGPQGAVSNVFGPGGLGTGINNALGGLKGSSMGDAGGAGGLGSRGTGAGGGGNALGIGGIGSGTGRGSGGQGGVDLGGRGKGMTRVRPGKVTYQGSLSREEIERVLRRVKSQIQFCYERELPKDPNLQGKIVVGFIIAGTGLVDSAKAAQNTMGNPTVEGCIMRIIQRLRFPKPRGGGQVIVNYPYVFSPG